MTIKGIELKDIALYVTSAITIASIIVKLTPTQKDDNILNKIIKVFKFIGLYKNE